MLERDVLAIPLALALNAVAGALNAKSRLRVRLAVALASLTLLTPFVATPEARIVRFLCAGAAVLALFRNLDLFRDRRPWSAGRRIWHLLAVLDVRGVRFVRRAFDKGAWARALLFLVPTMLTAWAIDRIGAPEEPSMWIARWLCGGLWAYASFEVVVGLARGSYRLAGIELPKLHDDPILSRTLGEFWGQRWNLVVRNMLHDHCFRPLARRAGVRLALVGTFVASALVHFWLVLPAAGAFMAASMAAFFVLQAALIALEWALGVARWRRPLQHLWVIVGLAIGLPLFVEPLLQTLFS